MSAAYYVCVLSWTSFFLAFWRCYVLKEFSASGIVLIVVSFLIAIFAGVELNNQKKK